MRFGISRRAALSKCIDPILCVLAESVEEELICRRITRFEAKVFPGDRMTEAEDAGMERLAREFMDEFLNIRRKCFPLRLVRRWHSIEGIAEERMV
jgi:hypothetical protein